MFAPRFVTIRLGGGNPPSARSTMPTLVGSVGFVGGGKPPSAKAVEAIDVSNIATANIFFMF
jgi:hypothetical protein